jgi:3-oxoacyl-[acyl-carrier-protein] synthase-1
MQEVYITADAIVSPLGFSSEENIRCITEEQSAITLHKNTALLPSHFFAGIIDEAELNMAFQSLGNPEGYTKLEKMMLLSLQKTILDATVEISDKTALLISTTKGNIETLDPKNPFSEELAYLPALAYRIKSFFGFAQEPIIVSNACVSGILAVAVAKQLLQTGCYENVFIVAGDTVSKFTLSGFSAFQAISDTPCKPYSKTRNGITLGEAAASVCVTTKKPNGNCIQIIGNGSCNDANHISGPSRTGEGLYRSIQSAMKEAEVGATEIDFISAHGTATTFNDEMEAIAFNRAHLETVPLHSVKGYYGHTLGASGLLEAIVGFHSMKKNILYTSLGMDELGVSQPINIIKEVSQQNVTTFLKTASGFGGCNTAVIFRKIAH